MTTCEFTSDLLADLAAVGVRLNLRGVYLAVDAAPGALTAERITLIRQSKAELIELLQLAGPCDGCGSIKCVDKPIHGGRSRRRDCAACGRTWGFPTWEGRSDAA